MFQFRFLPKIVDEVRCLHPTRLKSHKAKSSKQNGPASSRVLVFVQIFMFQDMLNENRFLGAFLVHSKRPKTQFLNF